MEVSTVSVGCFIQSGGRVFTRLNVNHPAAFRRVSRVNQKSPDTRLGSRAVAGFESGDFPPPTGESGFHPTSPWGRRSTRSSRSATSKVRHMGRPPFNSATSHQEASELMGPDQSGPRGPSTDRLRLFVGALLRASRTRSTQRTHSGNSRTTA
jgi:hypothetical protein